MKYRGRIAIDLTDRARLPWRFHGRVAFAVLPG
jgi:hypothetical protein